MGIANDYNEIAQCNRCGFCQTACPIFRSTGHEAGVARGRLALLRAIIEGRLDWNRELEGPLFNCLLCGACTANCFPAIPTADLIVGARGEYLKRVGRKSIHRLLFDQLLPYPRRLHLAAKAVAVGKSSRLPELIRALGLLRFLGPDFHLAEDLLHVFPAQPLRARLKPGPYAGSAARLSIGYFVGCGMDLVAQEAAEATLALLKQAAQSVHILDNCCCGVPAWSYGDVAAARRLATRNLSILDDSAYDLIVTDCSSCASFIKQYPRLFNGDDPRRQTALRIAERTRDMVAFMDQSDLLAESPHRARVVTYHDPCHACRGQQIIAEPRRILERLPGVDYRELPEADWCCGGAGSYAISNYTLSRQVLDRKIENVRQTGADTLVTSCPACIIHLSHGVSQHGLDVRVRHISQLLSSAD